MLMRRWVAGVLIALMTVPVAEAKPSADWKTVQKLKWDSVIHVELWSGQEYEGRFASADDTTLRLKVWSNYQRGQSAAGQTLAREQVRIVETAGRDGRDPTTAVRGGMAVGAVGGAIGFGIAAGKIWPLGVVVGGLTGAALGSLGGGAVALATGMPRKGKVVYQSQQAPPVARPPQAE